jgi:adenine-specific DNA-methyltransferase
LQSYFCGSTLAEDGSIYVHLDWHVGHYAKTVLDEIFGYDNFVNEIIWQKIRTTKAQTLGFGNVHDSIYLYSKTDKTTFRNQFVDFDPKYIESHYKIEEKTGRYYRTVSLLQKGQGKARKFGSKLLEPPSGMHWIWSQERIDEAFSKKLIRFTSNGRPEKIQYLDEMNGDIIDDIWTDIYPINSQALEALKYDTQKPEDLLERIIKASSNENDLVLDCFAGSGTTAAVSENLNRKWIACDLGRFAIHTTRKRLLGIENVKPFIIQNLGKYERQQWIKAEFDDNQTKAKQEKNYHKFILDLYLAQSISGYTWLHGNKAGRMVHIGSVDAPVSIGDVKSIIQEFWKTVGKEEKVKTNGIDILGWEFAFDLNETAKQFAAANKVDLRFKKIPKEVLEKRAVEQGDIQFFELASLDVKVKKEKKKVTLTLNNFNIPQDDIPEEVRSSISHWSQFIDYWAVDWNYRDDTFHNEWQSYRTKKNPNIDLSVSNTYEEKGEFTVVVKVIDILGNDTTKAIDIEVK